MYAIASMLAAGRVNGWTAVAVGTAATLLAMARARRLRSRWALVACAIGGAMIGVGLYVL